MDQLDTYGRGAWPFATAGDVRRALADLPDDSRVMVEWRDNEAGVVLNVFAQASDAIARPWGTDPITEGTVGVLVIEAADIDDADVTAALDQAAHIEQEQTP